MADTFAVRAFDDEGNWTKSGIFIASCIVFIVFMAAITYVYPNIWTAVGIFVGILAMIIYGAVYKIVNYKYGWIHSLTGITIKDKAE